MAGADKMDKNTGGRVDRLSPDATPRRLID